MEQQGNTPTIDQFRPSVLRVRSGGQEYAFRELCDKVGDYLQLSE